MSTAAPLLNQALAEQMVTARRRTDELFDLLKPGAIYSRPIAERHRLIFYLGHLEAFDWNQIARNALGVSSFQPEFDKLFEFGIDPPVGKAAEDQPSDWPSTREVLAYNRRARERIDSLLDRAPEQIVHVALEHRLMHAETLAYLFHSLPYDQKIPAAVATSQPDRQVQPAMIEIQRGEATLGQRAGEFGWDNEFAEHRVQVASFAVGKYKVTNGQYLDFVRDGALAPHFWIERHGEWLYKGMFAETPLPLNAPVYVTHQEASSYARWKGLALPAEAQFHRAAYGTLGSGVISRSGERPYPWGEAAPDASRGNFDFYHWDATAVDSTPAGDSAFGVSQLVGNGWEWTSTPFAPFPGFEPFAFYPGYSKNFFDQEHYVLKGASSRTAACMLRRSFRNWFRPNYPYVYAGFRVAEN